MGRQTKYIEIKKEENLHSSLYNSTLYKAVFDKNNSLIRTERNYLDAHGNMGEYDFEEVTLYHNDFPLKIISANFDGKYQTDFHYFDNLKLTTKKILKQDKKDILERYSDAIFGIIEGSGGTITNIQNEEQKEINEKITGLNKIISIKTTVLDEKSVPISETFEDYIDNSNNYFKTFKYEDTSDSFELNGEYITETKIKNGQIISEKITHKLITESVYITYFNKDKNVSSLELSYSFFFRSKKIAITIKLVSLEDKKLQTTFFKMLCNQTEDNTLHSSEIIFEHSDYTNEGKVFNNIAEIPIFNLYDETDIIFEKIETFLSYNKLSLFYEQSKNLRPIKEIVSEFVLKKDFDKISEVIPLTLSFDVFINSKQITTYNYIQTPNSITNQEYYIRVSNNENCGYCRIEYY